jgi:hypothetical protein
MHSTNKEDSVEINPVEIIGTTNDVMVDIREISITNDELQN